VTELGAKAINYLVFKHKIRGDKSLNHVASLPGGGYHGVVFVGA
jgi:hypothetical protein